MWLGMAPSHELQDDTVGKESASLLGTYTVLSMNELLLPQVVPDTRFRAPLFPLYASNFDGASTE